MKFGIITPGYSRDDQDWAIPVLRHLVRRLTAQHEVTIFTLRHPNLRGRYVVDGVEVLALGGGVVGGIGRIPLYIRTLRAIHQAVPIDILHGFWADEAAFLAVLAGKRLNIPVVASVFGGELVNLPDIAYGGARSHVNRQLSRFALKHANVVTAGSDFVADIARTHVPSANIIRWSQGVEVPHASDPFAQARTSLQLLHVGALTPVKDQATLLRAFARISAEIPNTHLTIAGEGHLKNQLVQLTTELGLSEKVSFLGHVAHTEMGAIYAAAQLLLLTSRHESQAMVLLEAIAHGCPVIGTRVGLIPELAPPELTAAPQDAPALARAALHLLIRPSERHALLKTQTQLLNRKFTSQQATAQICEIYTRLASNG